MISSYNSLHSSSCRLSTWFYNLFAGMFANSATTLHSRWGPAQMLGDQVWLTGSAPVHPKGIGRVQGQNSFRPKREKLFFVEMAFSIYGCIVVYCCKCLNYNFLLQHKDFPLFSHSQTNSSPRPVSSSVSYIYTKQLKRKLHLQIDHLLSITPRWTKN